MGFEVAKCLAQKNATVIIAARNLKKCEKYALGLLSALANLSQLKQH